MKEYQASKVKHHFQGSGYRIDGLHENDGYPSFSCNFRLQLQFTQSSSAQIQILDSNNCTRRSYLEFKKKLTLYMQYNLSSILFKKSVRHICCIRHICGSSLKYKRAFVYKLLLKRKFFILIQSSFAVNRNLDSLQLSRLPYVQTCHFVFLHKKYIFCDATLIWINTLCRHIELSSKNRKYVYIYILWYYNIYIHSILFD